MTSKGIDKRERDLTNEERDRAQTPEARPSGEREQSTAGKYSNAAVHQ
jgi:hypothetical protein